MNDELIEPKKRVLKTSWVHFRIEPDEREAIDALASAYGLARSDLIRQLLFPRVKQLTDKLKQTKHTDEHK